MPELLSEDVDILGNPLRQYLLHITRYGSERIVATVWRNGTVRIEQQYRYVDLGDWDNVDDSWGRTVDLPPEAMAALLRVLELER